MTMLEKYAVIKVMQVLLADPGKVYSLRELATASTTSKGATASALEFMKSLSMVRQDNVGLAHQYRADLESPFVRQWKVLFNLEELSNAGILEEIREKMPEATSVVLYGSLAKGTNDANSDLDLLVIDDAKKRAIPRIGKNLAREPNLMVLDLNEWKALAKKNKVFYENVVLDSIALAGRKPVVQ